MRLHSPYRHRSLFYKPAAPRPPKKKWRVRYVIWNALKRTCMLIGALVLLSATISIILSGMFLKDHTTPSVPDRFVLHLQLDEMLLEHPNTLSPYAMQSRHMTISDVVDALDRAAADPRVKGFVTSYRGAPLNLSHIQELRMAVLRFRTSGKFTYIYSPSYDSVGQYYLASAYERVWMQPLGVLSMPGLDAKVPFAKEALERIGVEAQIFARQEYKNLFESATSQSMSEESREMLGGLVDDLAGQIIGDIALSRGMEQSQVRGLVDRGLLLGDEAYEAGLIDDLDYSDAVNRSILEKVTGNPESRASVFVGINRYNRARAHERASERVAGLTRPRVALIYAVGGIVQYNQGGRESMGSAETLVSAIRSAADDPQVRAIVLRVDSPGGSPAAAESIRRAVELAREKGKKIVVSMGESAASGGYWIIADADRIFALPGTLTGSIGVTGGKFVLEEMWNKLGIAWDGVEWGENATLWSFNSPYSESETERMNALMDSVYDAFVGRVAAGRNMDLEAADRVARGRVWTGAQAFKVGLVDELGGLTDALDYVAQELGVASRRDLAVTLMPRPKTALERIVALLEMQASMGRMIEVQATLFEMLRPLTKNLPQPSTGGDYPVEAKAHHLPRIERP